MEVAKQNVPVLAACQAMLSTGNSASGSWAVLVGAAIGWLGLRASVCVASPLAGGSRLRGTFVKG